MRIHLIAVGQRMPGWIDRGVDDYARRLPAECRLVLTEIPIGRRTKSADPHRALQSEGQRMLAAIPTGAWVVALEERGHQWSSAELSGQLADWLQRGCDVAMLVGGPDGLAAACRKRANSVWALSRLTFPHALVRVVVAEQIYRAWSILVNHPYHRR